MTDKFGYFTFHEVQSQYISDLIVKDSDFRLRLHKQMSSFVFSSRANFKKCIILHLRCSIL